MKSINLHEFITSTRGHVTIILVLTVYLALLSAYLLADMMEESKDFNFVFALSIGLLVAVVFEYSTFFCAVNSYKTASWLCCIASIIVCRGTFEEVTPEFEISFKYFTSWVYTLFAPILVAYLSHKVGEKSEAEQQANTPKLNQLRKCKKCNKEFEPATHNQKYCSEKCRKTNGVKINGKKLVLN